MSHVAGGVVLIWRAHELVVRVNRLVKGVAGPAGNVLVCAIAPGIIAPRETEGAAARCGVPAGLTDCRKAIERVIREAAVEGLLAGSGPRSNVAIVARAEAVAKVQDIAGVRVRALTCSPKSAQRCI